MQFEADEVIALLRAEAERYEREAREHRAGHERTESKSVRSKKRAQARALTRVADGLAERVRDRRANEEPRRHGPTLRSVEWRDPAVRAELPERLWPLLDEIADGLDAVERRSGQVERRAGGEA